MKKLILTLAVIAAVGLAVGATTLSGKKSNNSTSNQKVVQNSDNVSQTGIDLHPQLAIYIKGQKQEIPAGIGIGAKYASYKWYDASMSMTDVHTEEDGAELHWGVMQGPVTRDHVTLNAFFEIWGKTFNSSQILDAKNGPEGSVKMSVNGQPNTEFENYQVKDRDKIEIRYE